MLSPEEEYEMVLLWRNSRNEESVVRLLNDCMNKLRGLTRKYLGRGLLENTVYGAFYESFFYALNDFETSKGKSFCYWVREKLRGLLQKPLMDHFGLSDDGRRITPQVLESWNYLIQAMKHDPSIEEICNHIFKQTQKMQSLKKWSRERVERAVAEVVTNSYRISYLEDEDSRYVELQVAQRPFESFRSAQMNSEPIVLNRLTIQEKYKQAFEILHHEQVGDMLGKKWLIFFVLHEIIEVKWVDICEWLENPDSRVSHLWPDISRDYCLEDFLPAIWSEICSWFKTPPPVLTKGNLRQWYRRANTILSRNDFF